MVRGFVEGVLGPLGTQVLDFYIENSLLINTVVLAYGLIMLMSWTTTLNIRKRLLYAMLVQMTQRDDIRPDAKVKRILKEIQIPWEEAIGQSRFPLVAHRTGLRPYQKSLQNVQRIITPEELAKDALMMIGGSNKTIHRRPKSLRK